MLSRRLLPPLRWWSVCGLLLAGTALHLLCDEHPQHTPRTRSTLHAADPKSPAPSPALAVEFNRDIRPILSDVCFHCHGPDQGKRKGNLRLDTEEGAKAKLEDHFALVPGKPLDSELYRRLISPDPEERMPPPSTGRKLTPQQIDLIKRWIERGARWQKHWSLITPTRPALPDVQNQTWVRNPLDSFVLARLEREGLSPNPPADNITLLRRVTLDLTGLPPTPQEVDAFLKDTRPDAYERVVDRLLESPHYGERLASKWLDAARYADTSGYQSDGPRTMWPWRDWVIHAFNSNLPFDQFTIDQLAGDLLPHPTLSQRIATGFNRNHRGNSEGGIIPEEYAVEYVVDRVETTATVWLGLTLTCTRCHDHKYDPFTQKDFYQLYAYFNNIPERGRALKYGNSPPYIPAPTAAQQQHLSHLEQQIAAARKQWDNLEARAAAAQSAWEKSLLTPAARTPDQPADTTHWSPTRGLFLHFPLDAHLAPTHTSPPATTPAPSNTQPSLKTTTTSPTPTNSPTNSPTTRPTPIPTATPTTPAANTTTAGTLPGASSPAKESAPTAVDQMLQQKYEYTPSKPIDRSTAGQQLAGTFMGKPGTFVPGRLGDAARFEGLNHIDAGPVGHLGFFDKFSASVWVYLDRDEAGTIFSKMTANNISDGYNLVVTQGKLQLNLAKRWLDDALRVETERPLPLQKWLHLGITYDGSRTAAGVQFFVNGAPVPAHILLDELNQPFDNKAPFRIAAGGFTPRFHGRIDDLRLYDRPLSADELTILATPESLSELANIPAPRRTPAQSLKLREAFREQFAPADIRDAYRQLLAFQAHRDHYYEALPTVMVMSEQESPRPARVLIRGEYDKPGEPVSRNVPASLTPLARGLPQNRLGLAKWLVSREHPLTARVTVNRFWQMLFGTGLVKTTEDFGSQGEWPSHLELLDWLAVEFQEPTFNPHNSSRMPNTSTNRDSGATTTIESSTISSTDSSNHSSTPSSSTSDPARSNARGTLKPWDIKRLLKLIVTSATYRQSSRVTAESLQRDPENRLLARGPRLRLPAETLRDQALALSGLLVPQIGGPSVNPYQPPGLWTELAGGADYPQDHGEKLYRRSLYTYWKRTVAPPTMMTFDASGRETCVVRETRTNTPLQALTLMNDVTFVEAARVMAQRVCREGGTTPADRLTYAFRLATSRAPTARELQILTRHLDHQRQRFAANPSLAEKLLATGEFPRDEIARQSPQELAAYTAVMNLILNLDEVITKE